MAEITTSLVVNFQSSQAAADGVLRAEIDSRPDGFNEGDTSFVAGDSPAYLIYKGSTVTITENSLTAGVRQDLGTFTRVVEETLNFINTRTATASFPIVSGFTSKWLGRDLGNVSVTDDITVQAENKGVGVLKIEYTTQFTAHRITNVPVPLNGETEFPVIVFIVGQTP